MNHAKKKRGVPDAMSGTPLRSVCGILCGQRKSAKLHRFQKLQKSKENTRNPKISGVVLSGGFNPDILPWKPCTATACKFPAKNTRDFFEVLLTLFEPPAEFNADITRPAFGTHPAAVLASVLPLSADK